jgi:hypothetical protein
MRLQIIFDLYNGINKIAPCCVGACARFQLWNHLTDSHEIWYEHYAVGFLFVISLRKDEQVSWEQLAVTDPGMVPIIGWSITNKQTNKPTN